MGSVEERPATEADIPFLLALRRETMDAHLASSGASLDEESHRARLMHHFDSAELLVRDGEAIGLLKARRSTDHWDIVQIPLDRRIQGQGLGRALIETLLAEADAAGVPTRLSVLKANPAKRLYLLLGFEVIGEDAHEYFMRRDL